MPLIDLNGLGHFKDRENAMIAEDFSASKAYAAGDYCYYNGTLYKFKTAHAAGAWTIADVEAAKLAHDVSDLKESFNNEIGREETTEVSPAFTDGKTISYQTNTFGEIVDTTNYSVSDIIPCNENDIVNIYYTGGNPYASVYFYRSDNTAIRGKQFVIPRESAANDVIVPETATYLRFSTLTTQKNNIKCYITEKNSGEVYQTISKNTKSIKNIIAPYLETMVTPTALQVNELRIVGETLYIVIADIAAGGTLTINTNVRETTISALIKSILN